MDFILLQKLKKGEIDLYLKEASRKKSVQMNLLASIEYGSKNPDYLLLFFYITLILSKNI